MPIKALDQKNIEREFVNTAEVAALLGVTPYRVYQLNGEGRLGTAYAYEDGTMRPKAAQERQRETWFLLADVGKVKRQKPGRKTNLVNS